MSLLDQLNEQQREAVTQTEGPLLVLAGAGSGKTRVITYKIAYLIQHQGVEPEGILAVTFTNKAAEQMRERVRRLLRSRAGAQPWISTFHSLCVRLLRRDGPAAGISRDFTIYDEEDQQSLVKRALKELDLDGKAVQPRSILTLISRAKNFGTTPQALYQGAPSRQAEQLAVIYQHYQAALKRANALDFDDLLLEAERLLRDSPEVAAKYNARFQHILVDEYQDTNRPQYELVRLLTQVHRNLTVVGDEDQSIYGWRGADLRNILEFEKDFPEARIIRLEQNYRSTKNILAAASTVVANNKARIGKTLWTQNEQGEALGLYVAADAENESLFVADWTARYLRENPDSRLAVLYRWNSQSRLLEQAMRKYSLKYRMVGGISFYKRAEIKDLLAYLRFTRNPGDDLSLSRIINTPPRGIGASTQRELEEYALENEISLWAAVQACLEGGVLRPQALKALAEFRRLADDLMALAGGGAPAPELLRAVLDRTEYLKMLEQGDPEEAQQRQRNVQELLNAARESVERGETLNEFLDEAALVSDADEYDAAAGITLMTMHAAKGLEFPVVFVVGLEEGVFPHGRSTGSTLAVEEERRLCYVAMTRAQERLILTRAEFRRHYGSETQDQAQPSRFLWEVPAELLEPVGRPEKPRVAYSGAVYNSVENIAQFFAARGVALPLKSKEPEVKPKPSDTGIRLGQRVRHAKYGVGVVLRREGEGDDAKLTVSFPGFGLKKLVEKFAGLEKV
jgi:DNA helicase-2/ATP-dependent DNA helicase PcrA